MLPEWTLPYFTENYTGPYLSDGRFQSSVEDGKAPPRSRLDALSREHDSAYARSKTSRDRRKADLAYFRATRTMGWFPRLAGDIVLYGNDPARLFGLGYSDSGSSGVDGGGANMGNENGRERATRLREETRQDEKLPIWAVDSAVVPPQAVVCYMPDGTLKGEPAVGSQSLQQPRQYIPDLHASGVSDEYTGPSLGGGRTVSTALRRGQRRRRLRK